MSNEDTARRLLLGNLLSVACAEPPAPGEVEEEATATEDVPEAVREAAAVAARIGKGGCVAWYWDHEDTNWKCEFEGLDRSAELDISPDGGFSELKLVYDLAEIDRELPEESKVIREHCLNEPDVLIELSLRRETFLDDIPELAETWRQSGVVLEFQCPNGVDYEFDALHKAVMKWVDDKVDASDHGKKAE